MRNGEPRDAGLTVDTLRSRLDYNPCTGLFTYRLCGKKGFPKHLGDTVGTISANGYRRINILGHLHMAHRLAWLHVNGVWPTGFVDHKDGNRTNNSIANLRIVTKSENAQNIRGPRVTSSHGWLGATFRPRQGWVSAIGLNRRQHVLGYFDTPEEAHLMYLLAKRELHIGSLIHV